MNVVVFYTSVTGYMPIHSKMCLCFQVTDIWYEHLRRLVGQRTKTPAEPSGIGPAFNSGLPTDFDILGTKAFSHVKLIVNWPSIVCFLEKSVVTGNFCICVKSIHIVSLKLLLNGNVHRQNWIGISVFSFKFSCDNKICQP